MSWTRELKEAYRTESPNEEQRSKRRRHGRSALMDLLQGLV